MRIYDDVWKKNLSKRAIFLFNLEYEETQKFSTEFEITRIYQQQ